MYGYDLCSYGLYSYGLCSYGQLYAATRDPMSQPAAAAGVQPSALSLCSACTCLCTYAHPFTYADAHAYMHGV